MNSKSSVKTSTLAESSEYLSLVQERDALNARIEKLAAARLEAISTVRMVVEKYSLTSQDIFGSSNQDAKVEKKVASSKSSSPAAVAPKGVKTAGVAKGSVKIGTKLGVPGVKAGNGSQANPLPFSLKKK